MGIIELLKLGEKMLELMSKNDIKVTDYKYIPLYDKYLKLRAEHHKYWYAIKVLSGVTTDGIIYLGSRLLKNLKF